MKKLIFLAIAIMALLLNTNAQSTQFGVKAGVNFAKLTGDIENAKTRTSFHAGGVMEFMFSDKFSLQPELLYSSQGTEQDYNGATITSKMDYLNLPLKGKFYVAEGFSLQAGPQVGYLIAAEQETDSDVVPVEDDLRSLRQDFDFGAIFGIGYKLSSGLFFDASYNVGLYNINNAGYYDIQYKNNVIQVSLGYLF